MEIGTRVAVDDGTEIETFTVLDVNEDEGTFRWLNEATGEEEVEPMWVIDMWEVTVL